jgi:hypothetical protein
MKQNLVEISKEKKQQKGAEQQGQPKLSQIGEREREKTKEKNTQLPILAAQQPV